MRVHHSGHEDIGTAIDHLGIGVLGGELGFRSDVGNSIFSDQDAAALVHIVGAIDGDNTGIGQNK